MKLLYWFNAKLVRRLVGPALILGGLAVLLLSLTTYYAVYDLLENSIENQLRVTVDLQEKELKRWIEDQKTTVVFISRAPFVRERVAELLSRDKDHPYYEAAYRELSEFLFSYIKNFPGLREISILSNHGGQVLISTTPENENAFRVNDTFFLKGKNELFIQGVYPWRETAQPTITIARPLLGARGDKRGVLAVHLNLARMEEVVFQNLGFSQTGEVYLVDKYNTFINSERFGRKEFPRGVHTVGIDRAVEGNEGFDFYLNYSGVPVVGYYRWMPELEVALLAEVEQSEAFYPAEQIGATIASFGLFLILCLAIGNTFFARRIVRPLEELVDTAQQVANGDFSIQVPVKSDDETGTLAVAFNSMIRHLQIVYDELDSTAEYFKSVFNLSPSAVTVQRYDNGAFVHVNESFCRLFDVTEEETIGRDAKELGIWSSDIDRLRLAVLLRRHGQFEDFEVDFCRPDGRVFTGIISSRVLDLAGEKHVLSILLDVSELRSAEQELRNTTERLQLLIRRMPVACITWAADFTVSLWNPMAQEIFGYSASEAVGKHAYSLIVAPELQPVVEPIWQKLLDGDETAHSVNENVTADGRKIVCEWFNTPLKDESGKPIGVLSMVSDVTEKKAAEENLRHQKELLQIILDAIPAPIFFKGADMLYQGCNKAFCEYLGRDYDQIVGHSVFDIAPPEKAEVFEQADSELMKKGGIQIYETKVRYADGSDHDVVFHKAVYRNPDGTIGGLVGNMLDVTDIRRAEQELAEQELSYREIFNAATEAIFIRDLETKELIDVNQAMLDMYGYEYDEALQISIDDLASGEPPYVAETAISYMNQSQQGKAQLFEWHARKKDGTLFWTEIALKKVVIQGELRMMSVVRDITSRKLAEQAQRESDERFQLLLEHAADALYLHDSEGVVLTVNQRSCDTLGYSRDELLGMNVTDFETGISLDELKVFWANLESGHSELIEGEHVRKDGSRFPVDVNIVKFEFHGAFFFLALARDVSERRATEQELERYRHQLEALVQERTEQLESAQEELVQKEKMAVLGQLTATVSHELRNPLGTVRNAIHLLSRLKDLGESERFNKALDMATRNVTRCDGIISELLDYTRKQEWAPVQVDAAEWLASVLDEQQSPGDIRVTRNWKKGINILCDPERFRRAVVNIYTNAVQAMQEIGSRKKVLRVKVSQVDDRVTFSFTDNGVGMDAETCERIFEPMFSTKNFGVGLGMPIVRNIMEEHGGGIEVTSKPGKGTTVILWLPAGE